MASTTLYVHSSAVRSRSIWIAIGTSIGTGGGCKNSISLIKLLILLLKAIIRPLVFSPPQTSRHSFLSEWNISITFMVLLTSDPQWGIGIGSDRLCVTSIVWLCQAVSVRFGCRPDTSQRQVPPCPLYLPWCSLPLRCYVKNYIFLMDVTSSQEIMRCPTRAKCQAWWWCQIAQMGALWSSFDIRQVCVHGRLILNKNGVATITCSFLTRQYSQLHFVTLS